MQKQKEGIKNGTLDSPWKIRDSVVYCDDVSDSSILSIESEEEESENPQHYLKFDGVAFESQDEFKEYVSDLLRKHSCTTMRGEGYSQAGSGEIITLVTSFFDLVLCIPQRSQPLNIVRDVILISILKNADREIFPVIKVPITRWNQFIAYLGMYRV